MLLFIPLGSQRTRCVSLPVLIVTIIHDQNYCSMLLVINSLKRQQGTNMGRKIQQQWRLTLDWLSNVCLIVQTTLGLYETLLAHVQEGGVQHQIKPGWQTCSAIHKWTGVLLLYNHLDRAGERLRHFPPQWDDGWWACLLTDIMVAYSHFQFSIILSAVLVRMIHGIEKLHIIKPRECIIQRHMMFIV